MIAIIQIAMTDYVVIVNKLDSALIASFYFVEMDIVMSMKMLVIVLASVRLLLAVISSVKQQNNLDYALLIVPSLSVAMDSAVKMSMMDSAMIVQLPTAGMEIVM